MAKNSKPSTPKYRYPPVYEKLVPVALGLIAIAIIVLLVISITVILGWFPNAG